MHEHRLCWISSRYTLQWWFKLQVLKSCTLLRDLKIFSNLLKKNKSCLFMSSFQTLMPSLNKANYYCGFLIDYCIFIRLILFYMLLYLQFIVHFCRIMSFCVVYVPKTGQRSCSWTDTPGWGCEIVCWPSAGWQGVVMANSIKYVGPVHLPMANPKDGICKTQISDQ